MQFHVLQISCFHLVLCCARAIVGGKDILTGVCVNYYYRHHGFVPEQQQ